MDIATPVFLEYRDILTRFIQSRIKDPIDQSDLLSEVMVKIYANVEKLSSLRNAEAWLITIARNTINDYFRDQKRRRSEALPFDLTATEERGLYEQLSGCVPSLIEQLPTKYALPLADHELKGISKKKLALQYGLSESGLKSRIQRGRKKLKTLFTNSCLNVLEEGKGSSECGC